MNNRVLILAAGSGSRMKSKKPKVLHEICGISMVELSLKAAGAIDNKPVLIVGNGREVVISKIGDAADYAVQEEQNGTGHAVMCASEYINNEGYVVVTAADMPLLKGSTLKNLLDTTIKNKWSVGILTSILPDPTGYGRIVKDENGLVTSIVEHRDARDEQLKIDEVNTSVYCFRADRLKYALEHIDSNNSQGELYLTDTIGVLSGGGELVGTTTCSVEEGMGVNTRVQLYEARSIKQYEINTGHMLNGVEIIDVNSTYIDVDVQIGMDSVIYPDNIIGRGCVIGEDCVLKPGNRLENSRIGDRVMLEHSVLLDAKVDDGAKVGPFAYLRPGADIGKNVKIGDFVEVKNASIGEKTSISHLTYVGDADVGSHSNIGCGVVFVNYNGYDKNRTVVGDNAFVGCNTNLVAPVRVEDGAWTAAGVTITEDVPKDALAIGRAKQVNKLNWAKNYRLKHEGEK